MNANTIRGLVLGVLLPLSRADCGARTSNGKPCATYATFYVRLYVYGSLTPSGFCCQTMYALHCGPYGSSQGRVAFCCTIYMHPPSLRVSDVRLSLLLSLHIHIAIYIYLPICTSMNDWLFG